MTERPLRVVHYHTAMRLADGGVVRAVLGLCTALARQGHRPLLLTHDPADVPVPWEAEVAVVPAPSRAGRLWGPAALAAVSPLLDGADALHLHGPWRPSGAQLARVARRRGLPYGVSAHGMLDAWSMAQRTVKKRVYLALVGRRMVERAAFLHCTGDDEWGQARRWAPAARPAIVPYCVDLGPYRALPSDDEVRAVARRYAPVGEGPLVLFLGRLHPKKGADVLVEAASRLRARGAPLRLLIVGPGEGPYVDRLRASVARAGPWAAVHGMVVGQDKRALYRAADVLALPTHQENVGLVLIESLAAGTPVVTTRGTDVWRDLAASGGATIAEAPAPDAFAAALSDALRDPTRLAEAGRRGRDWVFSTFDEADLVARYVTSYSTR